MNFYGVGGSALILIVTKLEVSPRSRAFLHFNPMKVHNLILW